MADERVVYLDQADWAYLHGGAATEAERILRSLGEAGGVAFLVTLEHLEEGTGLDDPMARAVYLREFPGTFFTEISGYDLLEFDAVQLARGIDRGFEIRADRLKEISDSELRKFVFGFALSHPLRRRLEPLHARRRELFHRDQEVLKAAGRRSTKQDDLALWRTFIRGDVKRAIANWERIMGRKATPAEEARLVELTSEMSAAWINFEAIGIAPPRDLDFDMTFVLTVFNSLPLELRRDREAVTRALKAWYDPSRPAGPLSCAAAVVGSVQENPARAYSASDQVDALHAAFAAATDVFTADKRTVSAMSRLKLRGRIFRTGHLLELAKFLAQRGET